MSLYRDRGVVLRTYKLGEADRIVVLLTAEHGKVRAVAKGVRKAKSRIGGRLEPLNHVDLLLWEGRELDIVRQADLVDPWPQLHRDLRCLSQGLAIVEATEQVAQEGQPAPALYRMLLGALRALFERPGPLVVASFYWKLLALEGAGPVLDSCASCGSGPPTVSLVGFDIAQGGALCRACRRGEPLSAAALQLMTWILGGRLARALAVPASSTTAEVAHLATISLEKHLERRLRVAHAFELA
jgi:DNA repair protein RecO (recombination protein O)